MGVCPYRSHEPSCLPEIDCWDLVAQNDSSIEPQSSDLEGTQGVCIDSDSNRHSWGNIRKFLCVPRIRSWSLCYVLLFR